MIVKKFQAPTEMEAVLKAKEDLGNSAVVLNVKTLKQRGVFKLFKKDVVEITAALEETEFEKSIDQKKKTLGHMKQGNAAMVHTGNTLKHSNSMTQSNSLSNANTTLNQTLSNHNSAAGSKINLVADDKIPLQPETAVIEKKLDSLHNLLKNQMDKDYMVRKSAGVDDMNTDKLEMNTADQGQQIIKKRENTNYKFLQLIYKKMIDNEVDMKYADEIIKDIETSLKKESNIDSILSAVYQKIILKLGEPKVINVSDKPKVLFFIGPTGVGKTTTIAKVASKFKLEKRARVAFITSDTYRIAAVEQLNTYASIIDCPVNVIYSADEMEECIEAYKDYDLILVDTAGRSHKSEEQMEELKEILNSVQSKSDEFDSEIFLTVSITTKFKDLASIADKYKEIPDWSIIFTKLDETCCLGNILNLKLHTQAPLSYTTSGQNVPDDIEIINEQALAKQLLGGNV